MDQREPETACDAPGALWRELRRKAGLSQGQVADALGSNQTTVSKIESGNRRMLFDEAIRFANACRVTDEEWIALRHRVAA